MEKPPWPCQVSMSRACSGSRRLFLTIQRRIRFRTFSVIESVKAWMLASVSLGRRTTVSKMLSKLRRDGLSKEDKILVEEGF